MIVYYWKICKVYWTQKIGMKFIKWRTIKCSFIKSEVFSTLSAYTDGSHIHTTRFRRARYTRSVREVSGLPLYLRTIVFERHLRSMNVNSKASQTYRLLAVICRKYSSCAACLCLQSYFWVRRILWLLKMTENQDQRICIKFCFQLGKTSPTQVTADL